MPKSRNRKNHQKKVNARNQRIQGERNKMKKFQDAFYQQMMADVESGALDEENVLELPKNTDSDEPSENSIIEENDDVN